MTASLTYSEKLRDPRWQRKRLKICERDNWTCRTCNDTLKEKHVHHTRYVYGREPWDYDDTELYVLCVTCHNKHHGRVDKTTVQEVTKPDPVEITTITPEAKSKMMKFLQPKLDELNKPGKPLTEENLIDAIEEYINQVNSPDSFFMRSLKEASFNYISEVEFSITTKDQMNKASIKHIAVEFCSFIRNKIDNRHIKISII